MVTGVPPGTYRINVERNGFVRSQYGARAVNGPGSVVTVGSGQAVKEIAIRMQPHAVISGRVLDDEGEPIPHVQVQAMTYRYMQGRKQLMPTGNGSTNDLGEYRIFGLPPGKYFVSASPPRQPMMEGPMPAQPQQEESGLGITYFPGSTEVSSAAPVTIIAGQPSSNIDIQLRRVQTVRVRGRILNAATDAQGRGRTGLFLTPADNSGGAFMQRSNAQVRPDGTFEFRGVRPGSYYLVAQRFTEQQPQMTRVPLQVGNSNLDGVEFALQPAMEVTGEVRLPDDATIKPSQVSVTLFPKDFSMFGPMQNARVNDDGTFVLKNVMPDTYRVVANVGGPLFLRSVQIGQQEAPNREITIVAGAPPVLTLILSSGVGEVTGRVTAESQTSPEGTMVVLVPPEDKRTQQDLYRTAMVDASGAFTVKAVPPGDYSIYAFDTVEPGAWQDPEFLSRFDGKAKKIAVRERETATAEVSVLKTAEGNP
jgi:hypothetical protein